MVAFYKDSSRPGELLSSMRRKCPKLQFIHLTVEQCAGRPDHTYRAGYSTLTELFPTTAGMLFVPS